MTTEAIKALVELEKRMKLGIAVCFPPSPERIVGFTISADEAKTILAAIEALKPMADMVMVPREAIQQIAERLDSGGRRLETAGNACEEVEAQLRALLDEPPMKLHFTNDWLKKKIEEDPDDMPETVP